MDQVTLSVAAVAYLVGCVAGATMHWAVTRKPAEKLPYAVAGAVRDKRIVWHEGMDN